MVVVCGGSDVGARQVPEDRTVFIKAAADCTRRANVAQLLAAAAAGAARDDDTRLCLKLSPDASFYFKESVIAPRGSPSRVPADGSATWHFGVVCVAHP